MNHPFATKNVTSVLSQKVITKQLADTSCPLIKEPLPSMLYYCDECNTGPLQGKRYRCQSCEEFDLCQKCFDANKHRENGHKFLDIKIEEEQTPSPPPPVEEVIVEEEKPGLLSPYLLPRQRKSTSMDPSSRMDELFNRINLRLPHSAVSSNTAVQFLDLYEQANESLKETKSKRVKALEQIMAKTALALLGVKLRKSTTKPASAADTDMAITAMKGLLSQLLIFNQTVAEKTELVRKELARSRAKKMEFPKFYVDVMNALDLCKRNQPKAALTAMSALDELKELLGYDGLVVGREQSNTPVKKNNNTKPSPTSLKRKKEEDIDSIDGKRSRVEEDKAPVQQQQQQPNECKVEVVPPLSPQSPVKPLKEGPFDILRNVDAVKFASSVEADEMRVTLQALREDLNDAHARIDVLVHLLRECVGAPLQRSLENLLKT